MKGDAEAWAREMESAIDKDIDPSARRISTKDTFGSLIDLHIDDLAKFGQPLRRSKDQVLRRLKVELGGETVSNLTRERLIRYGRERRDEGAGPATLAIDISFIGTVLTHAAAMHGLRVDTEGESLVVDHLVDLSRPPTLAQRSCASSGQPRPTRRGTLYASIYRSTRLSSRYPIRDDYSTSLGRLNDDKFWRLVRRMPVVSIVRSIFLPNIERSLCGET